MLPTVKPAIHYQNNKEKKKKETRIDSQLHKSTPTPGRIRQ